MKQEMYDKHTIHKQQYIHKSFDKAVKMGCLWSFFIQFQRHIKSEPTTFRLFIDEKWFSVPAFKCSNEFFGECGNWCVEWRWRWRWRW